MPYIHRENGIVTGAFTGPISGFAEEWLADDDAEIIAFHNPPALAIDEVNEERDRRIAAGFMFGGKLFQFDAASKQRVTGAATLAKFAVVAGVGTPGKLDWITPGTNFSWIAADNSLVEMDAPTCSAFGDAAAVHEQSHVFAARAIKNADPIPVDFTDDQYWP